MKTNAEPVVYPVKGGKVINEDLPRLVMMGVGLFLLWTIALTLYAFVKSVGTTLLFGATAALTYAGIAIAVLPWLFKRFTRMRTFMRGTRPVGELVSYRQFVAREWLDSDGVTIKRLIHYRPVFRVERTLQDDQVYECNEMWDEERMKSNPVGGRYRICVYGEWCYPVGLAEMPAGRVGPRQVAKPGMLQ